MTSDGKRYVGYEVRIHGGPPYRGITSDPESRLQEHREELGPSAYMRILTSPMTLGDARRWESLVKQIRGYYRPRRQGGQVWEPPQRRNGQIVRGHYRQT